MERPSNLAKPDQVLNTEEAEPSLSQVKDPEEESGQETNRLDLCTQEDQLNSERALQSTKLNSNMTTITKQEDRNTVVGVNIKSKEEEQKN